MLNEQEFIKDSSLTIAKYAEQVSKEAGDTIAVRASIALLAARLKPFP